MSTVSWPLTNVFSEVCANFCAWSLLQRCTAWHMHVISTTLTSRMWRMTHVTCHSVMQGCLESREPLGHCVVNIWLTDWLTDWFEVSTRQFEGMDDTCHFHSVGQICPDGCWYGRVAEWHCHCHWLHNHWHGTPVWPDWPSPALRSQNHQN